MNVVWFRTDLRVRDNMALEAAAEKGKVVGLYVATPEQWRAHDDAPVKLDFWRRNLKLLKVTLGEKNIPLVYCQVPDYSGLAGLFADLIDKWRPQSLHFNAEYPLNEARRDAMVMELFESHGINVHQYHDQVLLEPGSVLNNSGSPFRVFTPFAKKSRSMLYVPSRAGEPAIQPAKATRLPRLESQLALADIDWPEKSSVWEQRWPAGEACAGKQLDIFARNGIRDYKQNRDFPALDGTSSLSPWLNAGIISIRDCWRRATATHTGEGPETWKNELLWREFYRHIVFHYPRVSMNKPFKDDVGHIPWRTDKEQFDRWCTGQTGIPLIDAAMRQLVDTGWMHNRLRMVTAMFLSKHLLIDWRLGEQWFMRHLVDGDLAANNGGWQWSASTGTDSVPYFRVFNPVTQSRRFDESGAFICHYLPVLKALDGKNIHEPGVQRPTGYPEPVIELKFGRERALAAFKSGHLI